MPAIYNFRFVYTLRKKMNQAITFLTLGVKNLSAMRDFYVDTFGWSPMKDDQGIVFFKLNSFVFALYPEEELAEDVGINNDGSGFKRVTMAMNVGSEEEVNSAFQNLVSKGAIAVRHPEKVFWGGYRGYISDPENNYWEIAFNPFLEIKSDGSLK